MTTTGTYYHWDFNGSSRGDGVTGAPLLKPILRSHFALTFLCSYFEIESAFEYSHQLNIAWHSRKITVA